MDEGGDEISIDSLEAFDTYHDEVELSDIDEVDEEESFEVTSNSSSSHQEYGREFNSDNEENLSHSSDGSTEPLGEILEENNNDPNNNMEGGEGNQTEELRPIVELPVSPQPGCSKDFNRTENVDRVSGDVLRAAVRIQTFLHNTSYTQIVSILRERPNFELEVNKLFAKPDNETSLKRTHDDDDICQIEKKRLTLQITSITTLNEMEEVLQSPAPEAVLGVPEVHNQAQELTPPETQGQHNKIYTLKNNTPIRVDSSDDEDWAMRELSHNITPLWSRPLQKMSPTKGSGKAAVVTNIKTKGLRPNEAAMDWRDLRAARDNNGISKEVNMSARPTLKVTTAPATIVREEQSTTKTVMTLAATNPVHVKKGVVREIPAAVGPSQGRGRPDHSPIMAGHTMLNDVPTKIKIVTNGSGTHVIAADNYPAAFPQAAIMQPPRLGRSPQYQPRFHFPPPFIDPQPGSSTALNVKDQLQRDLREADRQIAERINYRIRQDAEKRRGQYNYISPQAPARIPPRPKRNISPLPPLPTPGLVDQQISAATTPQIPLVHVDEGLDLFPPKNYGKYCREIYTKLRAMFPNIKKGYIKRITPADWAPNVAHDVQFGQIVERLLANEDSWELDVPIEEPEDLRGAAGNARTVDETYEHLLGIFPDADPTFLRDKAEKTYKDDQALEAFIEGNLKTHSYPTREQYLSKMRITEEQLRYTNNFTVPTFLEKFPDPFKHFMDEKRKCKHVTVGFEFLKSQFNRIRVTTVSKVYNEAKWNMSIAAARLREIGADMNSTRKSSEIPTEDINMLQEMAFIRHQNDIKKYIDDMKQAEKAEFEKLKKANELLECQCCFDNECMPSKCSTCDQGHIFCNSCIVKGTDTRLGEGDTHVPCFQDCGSEFSLATLQEILKPTKFSILVKKRQAAEVAAAGLEGLVSCPFCHFASIPPEGDKVFKCLNPECMKESCIQCKEPNHVPLRCDEVGKADKARKYIEEKMTEALARRCYNCKKAYFKEEGCNKIECPCGAIMCYLCDKKIKDYSHFRGQGSDDMARCPLYSDNAVLNAETVRRVADEAKKELLRQDPSLNIETDHLLPTVPPPSAGPHQQILQPPHYMAQAAHAVQMARAHHRRLLAQLPPHVRNHP
ncbi:uncharacterized protein LOC107042812 [Diachasma alloeum]|uniref:uncharacterized protein LOC107042812 n=1 Tax=Diachasma alloeum TaxID=454923 RepID=UPI0007383CD7|nr:uncharacterized protein LOC107042812 [Diachasma alloeum]